MFGAKHKNCTATFEDFSKRARSTLCENCLRFGTVCTGGSHPWKEEFLTSTIIIDHHPTSTTKIEQFGNVRENSSQESVGAGLQQAEVSCWSHKKIFCPISEYLLKTKFKYLVVDDFEDINNKALEKFVKCLGTFPDRKPQWCRKCCAILRS